MWSRGGDLGDAALGEAGAAGDGDLGHAGGEGGADGVALASVGRGLGSRVWRAALVGRAWVAGARVARPLGGEEVDREIAEALVMAVALVTAMLNLCAAAMRLLEAERGRGRRGRGGRHRR